jgi:hypothetical protein
MSKLLNDDFECRMLSFEFDLPMTSLILVENENQLSQLKNTFKTAVLIGIDTETKPTFVPKRFIVGKPNPTALIQIAVRTLSGKELVFVVDMLAIGESEVLTQKLDAALRVVFEDASCFKVGQGLGNDMRELCSSYPHMKCFANVQGIVETYSLLRYLDPEIRNPMSLKNLVKQYLNFNLNKSQQMSDWSRRPLNPSQLHYAACDALVLLRLYDAMYYEIEEKHASHVLAAATTEAGGDLDNSNNDDSATATAASDTEDSEAADNAKIAMPIGTKVDSSIVDDAQLDLKGLLKRLSSSFVFVPKSGRSAGTGSKGPVSRKERRRAAAAARTSARSELGILNNTATLRGWQSESAKEWVREQQSQQLSSTGASPSGMVTRKRSGSELSLSQSQDSKSQKRPHTQVAPSASGAAASIADLCGRLVLPTGKGRRTVFVLEETQETEERCGNQDHAFNHSST